MDNLDFLIITADISYSPFRTPPRCRKPRQIAETFTYRMSIPSVTGDDAPVAVQLPAGSYGFTELRAWNGALYGQVTVNGNPDSAGVIAGSDQLPAVMKFNSFGEHEKDQAIADFERSRANLLIIDGEVWSFTEEPVYRILTLGMGSNHGGTVVDIRAWAAGLYSPARCFSVLEPAAAIAAAIETALGRGDTASVETIKEVPRVTVLIPTALSYATKDMRHTLAADEVRTLVNGANDLVSGELTIANLEDAAGKLAHARDLLWTNGIETVSRTP